MKRVDTDLFSNRDCTRIVPRLPVHLQTSNDNNKKIMDTSRKYNNMIILNNLSKNLMPINVAKSTLFIITILTIFLQPTLCKDMTNSVFGSFTDGLPAAFGDFDSDKFTDLFVLRNDGKTIEILLGDDTEPLFGRSANLTCTFKDDQRITSVVPADFDGDAYMDVLLTIRPKVPDENFPFLNDVYILWGNGDKLDCNIEKPIIKSINGQPLAMDFNQDMIVDLFGLDKHDGRTFWIFGNNRTEPKKKPMLDSKHHTELKVPHSHAFLDLNNDFFGDLYLTAKDGSFEIWLYDNSKRDFVYDKTITPPPGVVLSQSSDHYMGQTVFQDMALRGKIDHVVPVCYDKPCKNSTIFIYSDERWHNVKVHLKDWRMIHPSGTEGGLMYLDTLTLRAGDYNMDGYPDLLASLYYDGQYRTHLLENIQCKLPNSCDGFKRTFEINTELLAQSNNNTVLGVFYDFLQDGILDIIFVHFTKEKQYVSAFSLDDSLEYDANFVKVMVLTGVVNDRQKALFHTPLTKKQRIYGTNLPGPTISYSTKTPEGLQRYAVATQLPQSAHFPLNLPYTIFGLGRTPNFVEDLKVCVYGHDKTWKQLIPNSQMVVIPRPPDDTSQWKVQLFVTPSKLIIQSVFALLGICVLISLIIGALYWKERKEDHKEKLQEAQKFHFDAM